MGHGIGSNRTINYQPDITFVERDFDSFGTRYGEDRQKGEDYYWFEVFHYLEFLVSGFNVSGFCSSGLGVFNRVDGDCWFERLNSRMIHFNCSRLVTHFRTTG
jgi:hypothetical protein